MVNSANVSFICGQILPFLIFHGTVANCRLIMELQVLLWNYELYHGKLELIIWLLTMAIILENTF